MNLLWPELTSLRNLFDAASRAAAGKKSRPDVAAFNASLEPELFLLQRQLTIGSYRPGPYRAFRIVDPKPRLISAAPFRDRVVHHALTNIVEPIFERRFAGRRGRESERQIPQQLCPQCGSGTTQSIPGPLHRPGAIHCGKFLCPSGLLVGIFQP